MRRRAGRGGPDPAVRPFAGDSARSAAEGWAIGAARAVGVPAPELLLLDTVRLDGSEFPVMVQRAVPGRPLGDVVDRLSERQQQAVLAEIGGLVARSGEVQVDAEHAWQTAMAAELADRRPEREQILAGDFSAGAVRHDAGPAGGGPLPSGRFSFLMPYTPIWQDTFMQLGH